MDERDLSACILFFPEEVLQNHSLPSRKDIFDGRTGWNFPMGTFRFLSAYALTITSSGKEGSRTRGSRFTASGS
jgi:hypothetical protein